MQNRNWDILGGNGRNRAFYRNALDKDIKHDSWTKNAKECSERELLEIVDVIRRLFYVYKKKHMLGRAREYGGRQYKSTKKRFVKEETILQNRGEDEKNFSAVSQKVLLWERVGHSLVQLHSYHFPFSD